jgi:putative transposase
MPRDTTVAFRQPEAIDDPLSEVAREGARRMLAQVLIAEADSFSPCGRTGSCRMAATA